MPGCLLAACAAAIALALGAADTATATAERVYVGEAGPHLYAFDRDDASGTLTPLGGSPFAASSFGNGITATGDGAHVYVAGTQTNDVSGFAAPPSGGSLLAPLPGSPFAAGQNPTVPTLTVDGRFFYVPLGYPEQGELAGFAVDPQSGALTPLPGFPIPAGLGPWAVVAHPGGRFLAVTDNGDFGQPGSVSVFRIERQTGELTEVAGSPTPVGMAPAALAFTHDGRFLYVGNGESQTISAFGFNPVTGALVPVTGSPFSAGLSLVSGLDVTPDGRFLYAANHSEVVPDAQGITAFSIGGDGALHPLTPPVYPAGPFPDDLKVSSDGRDLYMTDGNDLRGYAIAGDGSLHEVPGSPFPVSGTETLGLAVAPTPPAPAPPASGGGGSSSSAATPTTPLVPPSTQGTVPGSGPMRLFGARILRASHRRVRVRVRCVADAGFPTCAASLRIRARAGRSLVTAARRSLELSAGQTRTVALRLSDRAWRLLVRGDALRATLLLTPDGRPTEPMRIRLAGPEH